MDKRTCEVCETLISGRADKRFCSDQCRATANNINRKPSEKDMQDTNRRIRKNRTILKTLCPVGKSTVRRSVMEGMGYDFNSFTGLYMPKSGTLYYLCYDYGFSPIVQGGVERALIVTKQNYAGEWEPWKFVK